MDKHVSNQPLQSVQGDPLSPPRQLSADALARRRMLIKGAGTGATSLAALSPMGAFASSTVVVCSNAQGKSVLCTISGTQSAAHSFGPNITKLSGAGCKPSTWGAGKNGKPTRTWPSPYTSNCGTTKVGSVLIYASPATRNLSLFQLMNTNPSAPEAHWLCALLNALAYEAGGSVWIGPTFAFPYSSSQVKTYYLNNNTQALNFFSNYLENV